MTLQLPTPSQRLTVGDRIDVEWYRKLQALVDRVNAGDVDTVDAEAAIAAIATALGSPDGTIANIPPYAPIDLSAITITGTNIVTVTGSLESGNVEIGGTTLEDSGAGALLGITRDAFGRVSGTTDATITGTTDRITVADGDAVAGPPTIDIAATYVGQTSITTLGTIATGTWQGTAVGLAYGGTGQDYSSVAQNRVWASPDGSAGAPTFRALVAADIPSLSSIYQPLDATLTAFAALTIAADSLTIGTGADAFSQTTFAANTFPAKASTGNLVAKTITDFALTLLDDTTATAARSTLGLVIGTNVQAWDATLDTVAAWALTGTATSASFLRGDGVWANNYAGPLGIGTSLLAGYSLRVNKTLTGSTNVRALSLAGEVQTDATGSAQYVEISISVAAAGTASPVYGVSVGQGTFGAGASVANQYAFSAESSLQGATTNIGFRSNLSAATGRWNFYANGTARNYFAGSVGIGSTTDVPSALLYITSTTLGFRPPSMTRAQRDAISAPAVSLMTGNSSDNSMDLYESSRWVQLAQRQPKLSTTASTTSWTINADTTDQAQQTALAGALTINAPTGTPLGGQRLTLRIEDNGGAQTIAWNAAFRAIGVTLPATTVAGKTLYIGCIWNATDSKWDVVSTAQEV